MLLRFNDVPRDASTLGETGFLDRQNAPRVTELIGRQAAVEAAYKKTGQKAVQTIIKGQPRALWGAIEFSGDEEDDEQFLRRIAERWERDFLSGLNSHEHYEILWHHLNWGAGHELRFFLPLWNKADQVVLPVPKTMIDRSDLWTRVQALTFGLSDPLPRRRAGIRPTFQLAERGVNRSLRSALTAYVEDAVMAGEITSRQSVIADLGKAGFEVVKEDADALTVRYVGDNQEVAQKARRPVVLTGPTFGEGFGLIDDPRIVQIEEAVRDGMKRLQATAKAQTEQLAPGIEEAIQSAVERRVSDSLAQADHGMRQRLDKFSEHAAAVVTAHQGELASGIKDSEAAAEVARRKLSGHLVEFQKVATETKAALVDEAGRELVAATEVVKLFEKKLAKVQQQLDDTTERKDALIRKLTFGLIGAGVVAALLLVPTLYFSIGGAKLVAEVKASSAQVADQAAQLAALSNQTADELAQHRAALTHAVELEGQVHQALQGMARSLSVLGEAVRIEQKADGRNALTIYTRRIPSVRNCDRELGCVARVDTRSN